MKVEIYGGPGCVYCRRAIKVCEANDLEFAYFDIKTDATHRAKLDNKIQSPYRTIPQIFVDGEHIGGYENFVNII